MNNSVTMGNVLNENEKHKEEFNADSLDADQQQRKFI